MDFNISGAGSTLFGLVEKGYNLISGAGEDVIEFVSEDVPGFISTSYEKVEDFFEDVEDSTLVKVGKSIAGEYLSGSSARATSSFRDKDPGYRKQAGARDVSTQRDLRGVDPQALGYVSRVSGMMQGLNQSNVPAIAELYRRLETDPAVGPNIPVPDTGEDIDVKTYQKYTV